MLQIDRVTGGWVLRWNEIQICPVITDVAELISLQQQLTLLLLEVSAQDLASLLQMYDLLRQATAQHAQISAVSGGNTRTD
jgi:hypothetical protein